MPAAMCPRRFQLDGGAVPNDSDHVPHAQHVPQQVKNLFPHRGRQQEVHDWIEAAVERRKQKSNLVGSVGNALPEARGVGYLGPYVEDPDQVVGHEADGEQEEDEEGLPGCPGVMGRVGQARFVLRSCVQFKGDLDVRHYQCDKHQPEADQHHHVDVGLPLLMVEPLVVKTPVGQKRVRVSLSFPQFSKVKNLQ